MGTKRAVVNRAVIAACIVCVAAAGATQARAQNSCPLSYFSFHGNTLYYQEAVRETLFHPGWTYGQLRYDLIRGVVFAAAGTVNQASSSVELGVRDEYTLTGPPAGTPFTIRARLGFSARADEECTPHGHCDYGDARLLLREGASNEASFAIHGGTATDVREVIVQGTVGAAFQLFISVYASAYSINSGAQANFTGQLEFLDIPSGARVTSCQGFVAEGPVAVRQSSWGRLKQVYR
ncbi:MAG TPA: hypothetical protein VJY35_08405 [Candidatus Eisenbacteria bacterium]|nr:hypothetical protein [Candidatus Eisenbacteria bacterium]